MWIHANRHVACLFLFRVSFWLVSSANTTPDQGCPGTSSPKKVHAKRRLPCGVSAICRQSQLSSLDFKTFAWSEQVRTNSFWAALVCLDAMHYRYRRTQCWRSVPHLVSQRQGGAPGKPLLQNERNGLSRFEFELLWIELHGCHFQVLIHVSARFRVPTDT